MLRGGCSLATRLGQAGPRKPTALTTWLASPPPQPHPRLSLVAKEAFSIATTPSQAQDPRRTPPLWAPAAPPPCGLVARGGCTLATGPRSGLESSHWSLVARGGNSFTTGLVRPGGSLNPPETCQDRPAFSVQLFAKGTKTWALLFEESPPASAKGSPPSSKT